MTFYIFLLPEIEMDNIEASEIVDIQYVNKAGKSLEVRNSIIENKFCIQKSFYV